jgi:hypothetical protein
MDAEMNEIGERHDGVSTPAAIKMARADGEKHCPLSIPRMRPSLP